MQGASYFIPPSSAASFTKQYTEYYQKGFRASALTVHSIDGVTPIYTANMRTGYGEPYEWITGPMDKKTLFAAYQDQQEKGMTLMRVIGY